MSDNQKHEQRRFAIDGIKNTGFYYTKSLVDGKYKLPILYCLQLDGSTRYNELQRKMETATFRSLSNALNVLFCFSTVFANGIKAHSIAKAPVTVSLRERRLQVLFLFRCCL